MIIEDSLALSDEPEALKMSAVYDKIVIFPEKPVMNMMNKHMERPRKVALPAGIGETFFESI